MGDSDKLSRAELPERFRKYLSFVAEGSDVELLSRKSVASSRAIHLGSEDRSGLLRVSLSQPQRAS